jgi:hypothetical protein
MSKSVLIVCCHSYAARRRELRSVETFCIQTVAPKFLGGWWVLRAWGSLYPLSMIGFTYTISREAS